MPSNGGTPATGLPGEPIFIPVNGDIPTNGGGYVPPPPNDALPGEPYSPYGPGNGSLPPPGNGLFPGDFSQITKNPMAMLAIGVVAGAIFL
jgi:hypothetical protein